MQFTSSLGKLGFVPSLLLFTLIITGASCSDSFVDKVFDWAVIGKSVQDSKNSTKLKLPFPSLGNSLAGFGLKETECGCPNTLEPRCGSNAKSYLNQCLLDCAIKRTPGLSLASLGFCPLIGKAGIFKVKQTQLDYCRNIPQEANIVCGSNGRTYYNPEELACTKQRIKSLDSLKIAYYGECTEKKI